MRLLPKNLLLIFLSWYLFFFLPSSAFAAAKAGINIGDHLNEFGDVVSHLSDDSWVYILACPGDFKKIAELAKPYPNLNIMIRGHYPGQVMTADVANAWIAALGDIPNKDFPKKGITLMPINEPNNPQDAMSAESVKAYTDSLLSAANASGLRGTRLKILSPMLDIYKVLEDHGAYVAALGREKYFSDFDGLAFNLYAQYRKSPVEPLPNPEPIFSGLGYKEFAAKWYGVDNKPLYAPEAGAVKEGDGKVLYEENIPQITHYFGTYAGPKWGADPNFVMFSIFSYDPHKEIKSPWIYNAAGVLDAMKKVGNATNVEAESVAENDKTIYQSWREKVKIPDDAFIQCGKSGGNNTQQVNISYYDTQYEGQVYKLKLKNVPVSNDPLTLKLTVKEGTLQHPDPPWEVTDAAWGNAREVLKPYDFIPVASDLSRPQLTDYIFAPVCRVETTLIGTQDGAVLPGKTEKIREDLKDKVKIQVDDKFFKNPGDVYPLSYGRGRFIQAAFISNQPLANKPIELVDSTLPDTKGMTTPANTCPQIPFEYLKNAIDVKSGGEIDFQSSGFLDGLKKFIDVFFGKLFPKQTQDLEIYFIWRQLKPMAKQIHGVYADEQTGFARAMLPAGQNVVNHGETLAPITPPAGSELERAASVLGAALGDSTNRTCPDKEVCQPDAFQNVDTVLPHRMLCSFLPAGVKERSTLGCDDTTRSGPLSCMNRNTPFRRLTSVVQPCNPNVTFSWESLTGATRYKVDFQPVRYDSSGKPIDNDADWHPKPDRFVTGTTDTINIGDAFSGQYKDYWWRVLAMDAVECSTQVRAQASETSPNAPGFTDRGIIHLSCDH